MSRMSPAPGSRLSRQRRQHTTRTHLRRAVQFEAGVRAIATDPAILFLEVGPGNALASLARLTVGKQRAKHVVSSLSHPQERRADGESVLDAAGRLWLLASNLIGQIYTPGQNARRVPLPTYPFERKRYWVEASPWRPARQVPMRSPFSEDVGDWLFAPTWTREPSSVGSACRRYRVRGCSWLNQGR